MARTLAELMQSGLDSSQAAELLAAFLVQHGYGVSNDEARMAGLSMIPLRRQLIVEEHGTLIYPEGTACAGVLMAANAAIRLRRGVPWGWGLAGVYTLF